MREGRGAAPSLTLPRCAGEGTLATDILDDGANLPPLPRSGGGLGRGPRTPSLIRK
ncbi:hypothetical protein LMG27198_14940 [Methylocystis echinoides]|uniref:Uncharacterized protein n=1 Tax=Methylocystis echinoides TaxID=29468 RepID=A0A9W6GSY0_9HYPH|nr:hypothetical protein LMG27198_14940 [Methylocystis echinoides]